MSLCYHDLHGMSIGFHQKDNQSLNRLSFT